MQQLLTVKTIKDHVLLEIEKHLSGVDKEYALKGLIDPIECKIYDNEVDGIWIFAERNDGLCIVYDICDGAWVLCIADLTPLHETDSFIGCYNGL